MGLFRSLYRKLYPSTADKAVASDEVPVLFKIFSDSFLAKMYHRLSRRPKKVRVAFESKWLGIWFRRDLDLWGRFRWSTSGKILMFEVGGLYAALTLRVPQCLWAWLIRRGWLPPTPEAPIWKFQSFDLCSVTVTVPRLSYSFTSTLLDGAESGNANTEKGAS